MGDRSGGGEDKPQCRRSSAGQTVSLIDTRDASSRDWVLMELQGEIETRYETGLAGSLVGDLHFSHDGIPILIIGHHILYGKVSHLERPFAVLQKHSARRVGAENTTEAQSPSPEVNEENTSVSYEERCCQAGEGAEKIYKDVPEPGGLSYWQRLGRCIHILIGTKESKWIALVSSHHQHPDLQR
ncbi:chromosome transmission fidelity protein 8 homolog isoform X2 [Narcine bancroftii]|uniref:chromosome transmission fidelity protein 8 homolog isoform X2 n=1 Tax=Narcine bancroftii TaxID=1343680 RepID=UPI003831B87D